MSVRAVLEDLERLGIELRVVGNDLEYEGPEESITAELLERLKVYKADLMAVCGKREMVEEDKQPGEFKWKLLAAGWQPKERCGKTIWQRPDDGFYVSQEAALHFLGPGIVSTRDKSGAEAER